MTAPDFELPDPADSSTLGRIFVSLVVRSATGLLSLKSAEGTRNIYFYEGLCSSLQSDRRDDQLGQVLIRIGWLTEEALRRIGERAGQAKVTTGGLMLALKPADLPEGQPLRDALRLQLQLVGASTFAWPEVRWEFDPFPPDIPTSPGLDVDPLGIVAEGLASFVPAAVVEQALAPLAGSLLAPGAMFDRARPVVAELFGEALIESIVSASSLPVREIVARAPDADACARAVVALVVAGALGPAEAPEVVVSVKLAEPLDRSEGGNQAPAPQAPPVGQAAPPVWNPADLSRRLSLNYFELLGVPSDAPPEAVKEAAKRLVAQLDPKSAPEAEAEARDLASKVVGRIRDAQITLLHPEVRRQYEASLSAPPAARVTASRPAVAGGAAPSRGEAEGPLAEARSMELAGDWNRAREAISRAIDLAPTDAELHARMGWYTYRHPEMDPAERERLWKHHLEYAVDLDPNEPLAHYYLGAIFANQGNQVRARMEFTAALKASPGFAPAKTALDNLGRKKEAVPAAAAFSALGRKKRSGSRGRLIGLLVVLAVAAVPLGLYLASGGGDYELEFSAKQLGTSLSLRDTKRQEDTLVIQVAKDWDKIPEAAQKKEVENIALAAKTLGMDNVIVFFANNVVAQSSGGEIRLSK